MRNEHLPNHRNINTLVGAFLFAGWGMLFFAPLTPTILPAQPRSPDPVVAAVGRQIFTTRDVDFHVFERRLFSSELASVPNEEMRRRVITEVIDDWLLAGWAEIEVQPPPAAAVEARFQAAWQRYEQLAGGPQGLQRMLEREGIPPDDFRQWAQAQARRMLLIRDAIGAYANLAGASFFDVELKDARRLRLAHILFLKGSGAEEQQDQMLEKALLVRRDIEAGIPFAQAARLHSEDTYTSNNGGLLGWFTKDEIDARIWDAALAAPFGSVTRPVVTDKTIHLVQVLDYETPTQVEFYQRMQAEEQSRVARLRSETDIFLAPGYTLQPVFESTDDSGQFWNEVEKEVQAETKQEP